MVKYLSWICDVLMNSGEGEAMQGGGHPGDGTYHWKYFTKLISGKICVKIEQMPHFMWHIRFTKYFYIYNHTCFSLQLCKKQIFLRTKFSLNFHLQWKCVLVYIWCTLVYTHCYFHKWNLHCSYLPNGSYFYFSAKHQVLEWDRIKRMKIQSRINFSKSCFLTFIKSAL